MQLNSLAEISRMTTLVPCEDRYVWTLESDGVFSVASIRKEIDGNRFQDVSLPTRWVKSVPIKVNIIAWKVKSNALPTRFNISRRGMDIDSIVCPICNAGVESTNHIFFQCVVVRQIMRKISSWWNIDYSDVNSYEEWRVWLVSIRIQSKLKGVLEGVYYGLWWYMWNFRNKLLFDKKIPEKALIFDNLVSSSFYWCKFRCKASFKWDDWLKNPYIAMHYGVSTESVATIVRLVVAVDRVEMVVVKPTVVEGGAKKFKTSETTSVSASGGFNLNNETDEAEEETQEREEQKQSYIQLKNWELNIRKAERREDAELKREKIAIQRRTLELAEREKRDRETTTEAAGDER
ncbi:RNA-directed DNA polymerase, eukaryota [Tanacetum coccineum]